MKKIFLLFLFLQALTVFAQQSKVHFMVHKKERTTVDKYVFDKSFEYFTVASAFSSDSLEAKKTEGLKIVQVDYVYSRFKESDDFNQRQLDKIRMLRFFKAYPSIYKNDLIQWRIVEQEGCSTPEECADYFHGFVVYFEKNPDRESALKEIALIESSMDYMEDVIDNNDSLIYLKETYYQCRLPYIKFEESYVAKSIKKDFRCRRQVKGTFKVKYELNASGRIKDVTLENYSGCEEELKKSLKKYLQFVRASLNKKSQPGILYGSITFPLTKKSFVLDSFAFLPEAHQQYEIAKYNDWRCTACKTDTMYDKIYRMMDHHTVSKVFDRNKDWENNLVVVDVTGSMYPYSTDLLMWLRLNTIQGEKQFVFFNDGDVKSDERKKVGSTGGIYQVKTDDYVQVKSTLVRAMRNGGGGDCPENNFEALLEGKKACPECEDVVMVADNWAFPRDTELLKSYEGRLKIVLCGTTSGINEEYLNLARKYKFTIHTMKSDLTKLFDYHEGQTVSIDGAKYMVMKNRFERVFEE